MTKWYCDNMHHKILINIYVHEPVTIKTSVADSVVKRNQFKMPKNINSIQSEKAASLKPPLKKSINFKNDGHLSLPLSRL